MKLFNKTLRTYLIYSFAITLVTIPLFYFVVRSVLLHSVDRSLRNQLHDIRSNLGEVHSQNELAIWSRLDKDIALSPADKSKRDEISTVYRFSERHHEQEPFREIAGTITVGGRFYELVISSSLVENEDLLGSILLVQTVLLISLIGGMLWINQRTSKKLWQPFYVALKNMQEFELNKQTDLFFKQSTTNEFNELNKAIGNLFSRNHEIFQQQKEFTENASHEMQTPLAIFQSKLELLMQTSPLTEDQAHLIKTLDDTNRRLIKLNKSLLLLTRIENSQYEPAEGVNVIALCERLVRQFRPYAERKEITIQESYAGALAVSANNTLLEILIGNLLSNAIRYNIDGGKIVLGIENNTLLIQNAGIDVALPSERIFNRFHKQGGMPGNEDSTGLGLAIVKNICTLYRYDVNYSFLDGWHRFQVVMKQVLLFIFILVGVSASAQDHTLDYYINQATNNSPLLKDYRNQQLSNGVDSQLLRATLRPQVNGISNNAYAPVISGFGYDNAITNGGQLSAQVQATKAFISRNNLNSQLETLSLNNRSIGNTAAIAKRDLKKTITAQYITAYGDMVTMDFSQEILNLLQREDTILRRLTQTNTYNQADYLAFHVTLQQQYLLFRQSEIIFRNDYAMLNYLCGIVDTSAGSLPDPGLKMSALPGPYASGFYQQYTIDSLKNMNQRSVINYSYKPKINAFADAGYLSSVAYQFEKNFGASVGLTLSIPIYDGKQRQLKYRQVDIAERTRTGYRDFYVRQYEQQIAQLTQQLHATESMINDINVQIKYSNALIEVNSRLLESGNVRITDLILAVNTYLNARNLLNQNYVGRLQIINQINYWEAF